MSPRRRNQNLTPTETTIKRQVAAAHGLRISRGQHFGEGSALQLDLAIITGKIATLMLDAEGRQALIDWITQHLDQVEAENDIVARALHSIQIALIAATERDIATQE
jgi:hypothetical protein